MKRFVLLLMMIFIGGASIHAFAQGMAATPPPAAAPIGKITAAAVWQPPQDFLANAHKVCDTSMTAASFPECFMNQIAAAGAPPEAMAFTRALYQQSDGQIGVMSAFKAYGPVDAAQVFYPLRANDNFGLLLVNGDPNFIDVDEMKKLDQAPMDQDVLFQALKRQHPQAQLWPGDRSGANPWPRTQPLPDTGTEFIVYYPVLNGCHACERLGQARFGWDFDANGKFLKTAYIPAPLPPRRMRRPTTPPATTPPEGTPPPQQ